MKLSARQRFHQLRQWIKKKKKKKKNVLVINGLKFRKVFSISQPKGWIKNKNEKAKYKGLKVRDPQATDSVTMQQW